MYILFMKIEIVRNVIKYGRDGFLMVMEEYLFLKKRLIIWFIIYWVFLGMFNIDLKVIRFDI